MTTPGRPDLPLDDVIQLFDSTEDGVYIVDSEQHILAWNDAAERITGLPRERAVGELCFRVIQGTDYEGRCFCRADCPTISCARRGEPVANYDVLARPGDARLWINVGIVVVRVAGHALPLAVHIFRDVTRRRDAELLAEETLAAVAKFNPAGESSASLPVEPRPVPEPVLTAREIEVLRLLAAGSTIRQIAQQLVVTQATVRNHIANLMNKLEVHSRLQAVVYAAHHGLL